MNDLKKQSNNALGAVMAKMMSMMGQDPKDILTEEQIAKVLKQTFEKFDKDNSGILENHEFHQAWAFLGLMGTKEEVDRAFQEVDTDKSGKIDLDEFKRGTFADCYLTTDGRRT